jgi:hypothetical protein
VGKKKDKKHAASRVDLESEVRRLRKENEHLRKRLKKIAALAEDAAAGVVDEPEPDSGGGELDALTAAEEASPVPAT